MLRPLVAALHSGPALENVAVLHHGEGVLPQIETSLSVDMPVVMTHIDGESIPHLPTALPAQLRVDLVDPERVLHPTTESVARSTHPDEMGRLSQLEFARERQERGIRANNFLKLTTALAEVFGFVALKNPPRTEALESGAPIRIGLACSHAGSDKYGADDEVPLQEQGSEPAFHSFISALHAMVSYGEIAARYMPINMKFWLMAEGIPREQLISPPSVKGVDEYVQLHPETVSLINESGFKLGLFGDGSFLAAISPEIGILGTEDPSYNPNDLLDRNEEHRKQGFGTVPTHRKTNAEFCRYLFESTQRGLCEDPGIQRDRGLVSFGDETMQRMYGVEGSEKPSVTPVLLYLRGASHLLFLHGLIPVSTSEPGCYLGNAMDIVYAANIPPYLEFQDKTHEARCLDKFNTRELRQSLMNQESGKAAVKSGKQQRKSGKVTGTGEAMNAKPSKEL